MLAAQLARRQIASLLIDGSGREGRGTAYSTAEPAHLLNVRADAMSAWPDAPDDFAAYCGEPRGFAERRLLGRYLRQILDEVVDTGHVELVQARAIQAVNDGGWVVRLDDGGECHADALALVALSRRGLVRRARREFEPAPVEVEEVPTGNCARLRAGCGTGARNPGSGLRSIRCDRTARRCGKRSTSRSSAASCATRGRGGTCTGTGSRPESRSGWQR